MKAKRIFAYISVGKLRYVFRIEELLLLSFEGLSDSALTRNIDAASPYTCDMTAGGLVILLRHTSGRVQMGKNLLRKK